MIQIQCMECLCADCLQVFSLQVCARTIPHVGPADQQKMEIVSCLNRVCYTSTFSHFEKLHFICAIPAAICHQMK